MACVCLAFGAGAPAQHRTEYVRALVHLLQADPVMQHAVEPLRAINFDGGAWFAEQAGGKTKGTFGGGDGVSFPPAADVRAVLSLQVPSGRRRP